MFDRTTCIWGKTCLVRSILLVSSLIFQKTHFFKLQHMDIEGSLSWRHHCFYQLIFTKHYVLDLQGTWSFVESMQFCYSKRSCWGNVMIQSKLGLVQAIHPASTPTHVNIFKFVEPISSLQGGLEEQGKEIYFPCHDTDILSL